ncbi:MAG TPA: MBL fold metallo-hydrolase [Rhodoferax sp.]|nr:MBL fold metallo-hydrolase [Rhodoferax sp.]
MKKLACGWRLVSLLLGFLVAGLGPVHAEQGPPMQAQQVSPSAWYVEGVSELGSSANQNFISNAGFVVTPAGVVLIDALGSPALATRLVAEIKKITPLPITHVLVTHYHADHIYGLQVFKDLGAKIVAHRAALVYLNSETAQLRLEASREQLFPWIDDKTRLVTPDSWVDTDQDLMIGGVLFQARMVGPAHTPEDLAFYLPSEKVLFAGDLVFRNRIPFVGQADSRHWITALDQLLSFDTRVIVPGHGPVSNDARHDMQQTRDYLVYLRTVMGRAAEAMEPFDEAYNKADWSQFERLPLFRSANRMNAYNTYLQLEHEAK